MDGKTEHTVAEYRAFYQRRIEACKQEIALYEEKLKMLEVFAADAKFIFPSEDKYADRALTTAVVDAVTTICKIGTAHRDGVETLDVQKYLTGHGFRATDHFHISLHVALKRLSDKDDGRLLMTQDKHLIKRYKPGKILGATSAVF